MTDPNTIARTQARDPKLNHEALRTVAFRTEYRGHFYCLNAAWLEQYFVIEAIDELVLSNPEQEIIQPGGEILFALLGDEVVGTCALKFESEGCFELTKMAVDAQHRGLGIGRFLLEAAIAAFKRRLGHTLFLETSHKLTPALRLYESVGFEYQPGRKSDSHYARADVYMIWRDPSGSPAARRN